MVLFEPRLQATPRYNTVDYDEFKAFETALALIDEDAAAVPGPPLSTKQLLSTYKKSLVSRRNSLFEAGTDPETSKTWSFWNCTSKQRYYKSKRTSYTVPKEHTRRQKMLRRDAESENQNLREMVEGQTKTIKTLKRMFQKQIVDKMQDDTGDTYSVLKQLSSSV
ncbi:hypothetical protein PHYSODRAFT_339084 [Phytophthora sojae]|uniref:Uncharacterized protein n=1 Tax=Phytophthora sojae (strain P6497) TaxID=1094619 RepID=G5A5P1_PHYSP|nr:hypothetical protein PHYSODRAFT_339084 [Phytophthora sojae]EGZ08646.1 hypothetical protein PHYSODRAFT_339084 [Phytophthora sojae]|eukprot:XP_009535279.1 hypothetical protein PHYSODRAFT_339084 [Phytophthora sojae]